MRQPPISKRTDTLCPHTTLFRTPSITLIGTSSLAHPNALIAADEISAQSRGMKFRLHVANAVHPVQSALIGRFNLGNLLAFAGVLHEARKSTRLNSSH